MTSNFCLKGFCASEPSLWSAGLANFPHLPIIPSLSRSSFNWGGWKGRAFSSWIIPINHFCIHSRESLSNSLLYLVGIFCALRPSQCHSCMSFIPNWILLLAWNCIVHSPPARYAVFLGFCPLNIAWRHRGWGNSGTIFPGNYLITCWSFCHFYIGTSSTIAIYLFLIQRRSLMNFI